MNGPKLAGILVLALPLVGLCLASPEFIVLASVAVGVTLAILWAVGAIIHEEWWPFRHF